MQSGPPSHIRIRPSLSSTWLIATNGQLTTLDHCPTTAGSCAALTVLNDHVAGTAIAMPSPFAAPLTTAVYVLPAANTAAGVNVTVCVASLYAKLPATGSLAE